MEFPLLQKIFKEASSGSTHWLSTLLAECAADPARRERIDQALSQFVRYGPMVEEEAFYQADARMRAYVGTPFGDQQRTTIETVFVAAAYSKLAMTLALAHGLTDGN